MPTSASDASSPVFVDPRGRRRRWAVLAAWTGSALAAGYVALVLSALLGGPTVDSPFLPQPVVADAPTPQPSSLVVTPDAQVPATQAVSQQTAEQPDAAAVPEQTATAPVAPVETPAPVAEPGNSGTAPGQAESVAAPGAEHRATPDSGKGERPQP